MNIRFAEAAKAVPALFQGLNMCSFLVQQATGSLLGKPGVYTFFEDGIPVHVGRTRNLGRRLRDHVSRSHNSASFAFKRARRELGFKATYTTKGIRLDMKVVDQPVTAFRQAAIFMASLNYDLAELIAARSTSRRGEFVLNWSRLKADAA